MSKRIFQKDASNAVDKQGNLNKSITEEQKNKNAQIKYDRYKSLFDISVSNDTLIFKPKI